MNRINKLPLSVLLGTFLLGVLIAGCLLPRLVLGATINVTTDGGPPNPIQTAIDSASAGDTISVADGTYVGNLSISKALTISAAGTGYTVDGDVTFSTTSITMTGATLAAGHKYICSTPSDLSSLLNSSIFVIPTGESNSSATSVTLAEQIQINVAELDGTNTITLPKSTVITKTDNTAFDASAIDGATVDSSNLSGLTSIEADLDWGLANTALEFTQAATINLFVGTSLSNPDFERGNLNGWTEADPSSKISIVSGGPSGSSYTAKFDYEGQTGNTYLEQEFSPAITVDEFSVYLKSNYAWTGLKFTLTYDDENETEESYTSNPEPDEWDGLGWVQKTWTTTQFPSLATKKVNKLKITNQVRYTDEAGYIDNIVLRKADPTLNVARSTSGTSGWTTDGITSPATCTVSSAYCSFTATKASYYALSSDAIPTPTPTPTPTSVPSTTTTAAAAAPTCDKSKPGTPTLYDARATGSNQVTLYWTEATNATSWTIAYGRESGNYIWGFDNFGDTNSRSAAIRALSPGTYYFVVRANNGCMPGDFSEEKRVAIAGAAVVTEAPTVEPGIETTPRIKEVAPPATPTPTAVEQPAAPTARLAIPAVLVGSTLLAILGFIGYRKLKFRGKFEKLEPPA